MTPKEYEAELKDLESKIERLRSLYDQYFRGIEKLPPVLLKKEVESKIRNLSKVHIRTTALRFKLQVQIQKYTTFLAYWQRMMREMEEGKLKKWKKDEEETGKLVSRDLSAGNFGLNDSVNELDIPIDLDSENDSKK